MSLRSFRATLVAAALVATTLVTAVPARASDSFDSIEWNMAPCATAILSEAHWDYGAKVYVVDGGATQCEPVALSGGVRIATYTHAAAAGAAPGFNIRLFADASPGTVRYFGVAAVPAAPGEYGVCVLAGDYERISCVTVSVLLDLSRPSATVRPLATDAPLVAKPVFTSPYTGAIGPATKDGTVGHCGTCF